MDNKAKLLRRLIALFVIMVLLAGVSGAGLFSLQVINGAAYHEQAQNRLTSSSTVSASRGEIVDRYGRPLVTNESVYSLRIDYPYWDQEKQNNTILQLVQLIRDAGSHEVDSLPISDQAPFEYIGEADSDERELLDEFIKDREWGSDLTAEEVIAKMRDYYEVDSSLSDGNARIVVGVRYEMQQSGFSMYNSFIIASDVSLDLISQVKEQHSTFMGVNVETQAVRKYETTHAAHILGRVSKIYKEDWEGEDGYKAKGYNMNAMVGREGLEKSFEEYLHGTDGTRSIETDISGKITNVIEGEAPQPGNNVITTLDLDLQKAAEDSLANTLSAIPGAGGGAAVAMDVNTGEVLAMASYPTIDLTQWNEMYSIWAEDEENTPLLNRAIQGAYQPGSTYKPLTAIAGLEEGVIDENTLIDCKHYYDRFQSRTYKCMGNHGPSDVLRAIQKSCNIFFYETGYLLGGEKEEEWAHKFGFGEKTGIELAGERAGTASGPKNRENMLENNPLLNPWQPGDVITTAIGQCDLAVTPLQLANYTAAIANGGTLYKPTLLKSVKTYDYTQTVKEQEPEVLKTIEVSDKTWDIVHEGMAEVTDDEGTAAATFATYPIKVAGKSGTAQHGQKDKEDHAVFIAYAPYDDPQIAVAVVGEYAGHGADVAPIARDIFDAYFANNGTVNSVDYENTLLK